MLGNIKISLSTFNVSLRYFFKKCEATIYPSEYFARYFIPQKKLYHLNFAGDINFACGFSKNSGIIIINFLPISFFINKKTIKVVKEQLYNIILSNLFLKDCLKK